MAPYKGPKQRTAEQSDQEAKGEFAETTPPDHESSNVTNIRRVEARTFQNAN